MAESLKQIALTTLVLIMLVAIYMSVGPVNDAGQADTEEAVLLRAEIAAAQVQVNQLEAAFLVRAKQPCPDPKTREEPHAQELGHGDICRTIDDRSKWVCPQMCDLAPRKKPPYCVMKGHADSPCRIPAT